MWVVSRNRGRKSDFGDTEGGTGPGCKLDDPLPLPMTDVADEFVDSFFVVIRDRTDRGTWNLRRDQIPEPLLRRIQITSILYNKVI